MFGRWTPWLLLAAGVCALAVGLAAGEDGLRVIGAAALAAFGIGYGLPRLLLRGYSPGADDDEG